MKLPYFQERDDGSKGSIQVKKEEDLKKKQIQKLWRQSTSLSTHSIDNNIQRRDCSSVCRHTISAVGRLEHLSTSLRGWKTDRVRIRFRFLFLAHFVFLFWWAPNRTQFLFFKDLFLKIQESRILLDQGDQLLIKLIKFFKHLTTKIISKLE